MTSLSPRLPGSCWATSALTWKGRHPIKTRAEAARLVLSLGLIGFVVMADNWVVSPILPSIAGSIAITPIKAAILIPAYMLPFGLLQLFYGPLADRYGKLKVLWVAMIGFTIACGLTAAGAS